MRQGDDRIRVVVLNAGFGGPQIIQGQGRVRIPAGLVIGHMAVLAPAAQGNINGRIRDSRFYFIKTSGRQKETVFQRN